MTRSLEVVHPGPLTTVQDEGRPGRGALGVGRSGAADRAAAGLANRLVGNDRAAAVLEVTLGGLVVRASTRLLVVTAGARCPGAPHCAPRVLEGGQVLRLGAPSAGLRTYLAVRGGIEVPAVLGSRSTDLLSGVGPAPLAAGDVLPVGTVGTGAPGPPGSRELPGVDVAPVPDPPGGTLRVRASPGPRRGWFDDDAWASLGEQVWTASPRSNRVGVHLDGDPLRTARTGQLPSEGLVRGALQVPPSGRPVLFLADHPVTGGYPIVAYVAEDDVDRCAQLRPGQGLRIRLD